MADPLPEIYCDLNARMTEHGYSLERPGSLDDLSKSGLTLAAAVGKRFTFYADDTKDDGTPDDIMFFGSVVSDPLHGYLAVKDGDFYHRSESSRG